jgi:hypothetical protein
VDRLVALLADELGLGDDGLGDAGPEAGLAEHGDERAVIGCVQVGVVVVEPLHGQLQRPPGMEAGGARVRLDVLLDLAGGVVECWPFGLEEGEVAHLRLLAG